MIILIYCFVDNNLLKFKDIIKPCLLLLVNQFINNKLKDIFVYTREVHSHFTRNSTSFGLYMPMIHSSNYGINSIKYMAPNVWNEFSRFHPEISEFRQMNSFKKFQKKLFYF